MTLRMATPRKSALQRRWRRRLIEFDQLSLRHGDHGKFLARGPADFADHEIRARQLLDPGEAEQLRHKSAHRSHVGPQPCDGIAFGQSRNRRQQRRERRWR